jgi:hypothetical protein
MSTTITGSYMIILLVIDRIESEKPAGQVSSAGKVSNVEILCVKRGIDITIGVTTITGS